MNRVVYILSVFLFLSGSLFAQKDAKAKDLLDKASDKFQQKTGISANFTLNIKDIKAKLTQSFDGGILIKGSKFYLSTPDADTWFDGKTQWVYFKGSDEVNISEPSARDIQMMNPASIFTLYKAGSNYKYIGEKTDIKKRAVYEVELIPQNKDADMKKILVQINKTDYMPVFFHIFYSKGNVENIIYINKYETGLNQTDNTFIFDKKKYPDAEIIDLR